MRQLFLLTAIFLFNNSRAGEKNTDSLKFPITISEVHTDIFKDPDLIHYGASCLFFSYDRSRIRIISSASFQETIELDDAPIDIDSLTRNYVPNDTSARLLTGKKRKEITDKDGLWSILAMQAKGNELFVVAWLNIVAEKETGDSTIFRTHFSNYYLITINLDKKNTTGVANVGLDVGKTTINPAFYFQHFKDSLHVGCMSMINKELYPVILSFKKADAGTYSYTGVYHQLPSQFISTSNGIKYKRIAKNSNPGSAGYFYGINNLLYSNGKVAYLLPDSLQIRGCYVDDAQNWLIKARSSTKKIYYIRAHNGELKFKEYTIDSYLDIETITSLGRVVYLVLDPEENYLIQKKDAF